MKYYSKSPEEWKKEDQEKNQNDRISQLRARAWRIFFLNLIIVIGAFSFIAFYLKLSGYPVSFFLQRSTVKGDVKVFISFNGSDGDFALGQPVEVLVYAQNTSKSEKNISIEDFSFRIKDSVGRVVYSFLYSSKVEKKVGKFENILIFDLKREKILNNLKEGEYTALVNLKINGSEITVLKNFNVRNKLRLLLAGYQPFYFIGEIPSFNVEVVNDNYKNVSIYVKNLRLEIKDSVDAVIWSDVSKIGHSYDLPAGTRSLVKEIKSILKFDKVGIYKQVAILNYDGGQLLFSKAFQVISKRNLSIENVKILIESPIYLSIGDSPEINVYVYNESKEDRFVLIKDGRIFLQGPEVHSLGSFKNMRIWISGNKKIAIFSTDYTFNLPGTYKIVVFFQTDNGDLYKELIVKVGGAGE